MERVFRSIITSSKKVLTDHARHVCAQRLRDYLAVGAHRPALEALAGDALVRVQPLGRHTAERLQARVGLPKKTRTAEASRDN